MGNYVNNQELSAEIIKSKALDRLTPKAIELFQRMIKESFRMMRYKYNEDKEDCMSFAMKDILEYWRNFDPNHPKANAFAYFTQYIKNGAGKGYNMLHPESKKKVKLVSISDTGGIYNI